MTTRAPKRVATAPPAAAECVARSVRTHSLTGTPASAGVARGLLRAQLTAWNLEPLTDDAQLLVGELVANAVTHTGNSTVHLFLERTTTVLRLAVEDASRTLPCLLPTGPGDENGRGLQIVAALAHRWGASFTVTGKTTWCELRLPRTR